MIQKAKWIWADREENPRNKWVLFKREFEVQDDLREARLEITADSRYLLYLNGVRVHKGPNKAFPESYQFDCMDIARHLVPGTNLIEIKVNHIGMSTHQYILGRAGLIASMEMQYACSCETVVTDERWLFSDACGFMKENIRISAGQAYSELYDADIGEQAWRNAHVIGAYGMMPWGALVKSVLAAPTFERTSAVRVLEASEVALDGKLIHIDLHPFFIGEIQKPEFFYLVTNIRAEKALSCNATFPYSRLWCCYGEFMINGREYATEMRDFVFEPIAAGSKTWRVELDEGDNLFAMRMDNIAMGMHVGLYFDCAEGDIEFISPFSGKTAWCGVTSLLNPDSHLVNLASGDWINHPVNPNVADNLKENARTDCWEKLRRCDAGDLQLQNWVREIGEINVSHAHPQHSILTQKKMGSLSIDRNIENLILDNQDACVLDPGSKDFLLDFGEEVSGYVFFDIDESDAGEILDFSGFEYRDWHGKNQEMDGVNNGLRYLTKKGKQSFISHISRAFRYLNVTVRSAGRMKIRQIGLYQSSYPVTKIGEFQCDDHKLNKIFEIAERTTKLCMQDTFVDCPGHEQSFWIGDFRNEALISLYLYNSEKIIENGHMVALGALKTGILPKASVPSAPQGITPTWTLLWLMSFWELYFYRPNPEAVQYYDEMKQCVEVFVSRIDESGLIRLEWNDMLDWAPMDIGAGRTATNVNAEVYHVLRCFGKFARAFGKEEDANRFEAIGETLKQNVMEKLWSRDRGAFADSLQEGKLSESFSTQANSMAYLCGCCSAEQEKILKAHFLKGFPRDFQKINSPFASFFLYEALEKAGMTETLIADIREKWGEMLDYGATTCFETFPGWEKEILTRSHCHAWSAAPCYFFLRDILGVKPVEPGFATVEVRPVLGDLNWAYGAVPVPNGRMVVHVKKENGQTFVRVRKPKFVKLVLSDEYVYSVVDI